MKLSMKRFGEAYVVIIAGASMTEERVAQHVRIPSCRRPIVGVGGLCFKRERTDAVGRCTAQYMRHLKPLFFVVAALRGDMELGQIACEFLRHLRRPAGTFVVAVAILFVLGVRRAANARAGSPIVVVLDGNDVPWTDIISSLL